VVDVVLALARLRVVDGLDAVAVGIEDECAVVARRVLRARAGRAVVAVAGARQRAPPCVDLLTRAGHERNVEVPRDRPVVTRPGDGEVVPLEEVPIRDGLGDAEHGQRGLVEAARGVEIGDADRDVVEHG